jgi:hypothetical protein
MKETTPRIQRIYLRFSYPGSGMMKLHASLVPPAYDEPLLVLLSRGVMPMGQPFSTLLVSDPTQNEALRGKAGKDGIDGTNGTNGIDGLSAYQLARQQGYGGTLTAWLASLVGAAGLSAYEIARELGYGGTKTQWLASLNGAPGKNASAILGSITIGQTATVAISAGTRRIVVTIPASWGVVAGDPLVALPSAAVAGYAVHDVVAVSATSLSIGITAPLLAIGASFSIPCRIARLNT